MDEIKKNDYFKDDPIFRFELGLDKYMKQHEALVWKTFYKITALSIYLIDKYNLKDEAKQKNTSPFYYLPDGLDCTDVDECIDYVEYLSYHGAVYDALCANYEVLFNLSYKNESFEDVEFLDIMASAMYWYRSCNYGYYGYSGPEGFYEYLQDKYD